MYTHGSIFVLVKEPYEYTLQEFISKNSKEYVLISWQFVVRSIEEVIVKTVSAMKKIGMSLNRFISTEDMVYVFGEWKLHSPEMFVFEGSTGEEMEINDVLTFLHEEIYGRIGVDQNHP